MQEILQQKEILLLLVIISDERLKENIKVIDNPINKVKQLKGVTI